jgi:hypothetical protein
MEVLTQKFNTFTTKTSALRWESFPLITQIYQKRIWLHFCHFPLKINEMKTLFILLSILFLNKDCSDNKSMDSTLNAENTSMMQENTSISYEETTRGFYERVWITKDSITVTNDRNHNEKINVSTPGAAWNELMAILNTVNISELPNLEAPTTLRHHDGARFTTLSVTQNQLETSTASFDHGHPPKAIETLVNKVLSMRKLVPKK